jgi:hypothetical protein
MTYLAAGFTPEQEKQLLDSTAAIAAAQKADAEKRRWYVIFGAAGALFAAARLGIVAIPFIKERRARRR